MKVDSAEKNQYDIQFYRTNGINGAEQWSDGNHTDITVNGTGFVSMSFTQSTAKENQNMYKKTDCKQNAVRVFFCRGEQCSPVIISV